MNFEQTDDQNSIQDSIQKICRDFDDDYWLQTSIVPWPMGDGSASAFLKPMGVRA